MFNVDTFKEFIAVNLQKVSSETIGWLAVLFLHGATIPPVLGLLFGLSDRLPSIDVILFLWSGLVLLFIRALVNKDMLNIITIGTGFIVHAGLLGLLVFR